MERIEHCVSFLVNKAAQGVSRRARDALAAHGVTPAQFAVLMALWERDGQSGAEVGARLQIDSATVTGVLDRLEAAGLVERRACPADRRVQRLHVTTRGRAARPALEAAMDEVNAAVARDLGADAPLVWAALRRMGERA